MPTPAGAPRRVLVIGAGGAGKSTLARRIGARLGIPVVHLDAQYWRAGWVAPPAAEWQTRVAALAAEPRWVMDGNYGGTLDLRVQAADTIVFLDMPRVLSIVRVVRRAWRHRGRTRPDMAPGCPEQLTWEFLSWIWTYRRRRRPEILRRLAAAASTKHVVHLRSRREVEAYVAALPNDAS